MKKCILLVRASTIMQTIEDQTAELVKMANNDGYKKPSQRIIIANNESGFELSEEERLGINSMKDYLENDDSIDCVYAWSVSRIGRNDKVNASVKNYLIERKIQLKTQVENLVLLDNNKELNKGAEIIFNMFSTLAKQGAQDIKANTIRGKERSMKEGKSAHGKILYGYKKGKNGIIEEDPIQADHIRDIFNWYVEKEVAVVNIYRELADKGVFHEYTTERSGISRIRDILKNPSYYGAPHLKEKLKKKNAKGELEEKKRDLSEAKRYPAIISKEIFDAAQKRLSERISQPKINTKYVYYAKGLIRFMGLEKPHKMVANRQTITYRVPDNLHRFSISINTIDTILWEAATHLYYQMQSKHSLMNKEQLQAKIDDNNIRIKTAEQRISEQKAKDERAYHAYEDGLRTYEQYKKSHSEMLTKIKEQNDKIISYKEQNTRIKREIKRFGEGAWNIVDIDKIREITNDVERKKIIDIVIKSIDIYPTQEGCEIRIEVPEQINWFGYPHTYTYKSRGGRITLLKHTHRITGEVITSDVSKKIVKRFERTDIKGDRHKSRKKMVLPPTILDD